MDKKYLDVKEACEFLGISRPTLYRLKEEGLPYFKLRGSLKFDKADLEEWIETLKQSDKK